MKPWLHKIESFVDRAIPYALIVLAFIIITELFFKEFAEKYHIWLLILDYIVIGLFIIDLGFKYNRIRNFKNFFKECWLDIIAVFPFVLVFRIFETFTIFARLPAEIKEGQSILHTIVEGRKEISEFFGRGGKLIEEAKLAGEISRTEKILKVMRPLARSPRLVKAIPFYEKPIGKHHLHEMEELKEAEQEIEKAGRKAGKGLMRAERFAEGKAKSVSRKLKKNLKEC
ncbi:MAG: ion transporter [Nanoarchaeota archaeon]|nr:ion transporter [Nanoarchaeota archaeon]